MITETFDTTKVLCFFAMSQEHLESLNTLQKVPAVFLYEQLSSTLEIQDHGQAPPMKEGEGMSILISKRVQVK